MDENRKIGPIAQLFVDAMAPEPSTPSEAIHRAEQSLAAAERHLASAMGGLDDADALERAELAMADAKSRTDTVARLVAEASAAAEALRAIEQLKANTGGQLDGLTAGQIYRVLAGKVTDDAGEARRG